MMNRCLRLTVLILTIIILARGSLCFFAEEEDNKKALEENLRLLCDFKVKPIILVRGCLLCFSNITGSDIEKKKFTKKFEEIAGPELSKFVSTKSIDEFESFTCSDPKKTVQMLDQLLDKIDKEGNVTWGQFTECLSEKFDEMHYEGECVKKDEGLRKARTVGQRCKQNFNNENCTAIRKKIISNPEKASEIACASKETYMGFREDKSCTLRGSDKVKFMNCIKSSVKK